MSAQEIPNMSEIMELSTLVKVYGSHKRVWNKARKIMREKSLE